MTTRFILAVLASLALAGCGGNPLGTGTDGGGGTGTGTDNGGTDNGTGGGTPGGGTPGAGTLIPSTVSLNVGAAGLKDWASGDPEFKITMTAQDAADLTATYSRDNTRDAGPYEAYTYQSTTSNRMVVALVRKVNGIAAVTAVEAGQFSDYHGGGQIWRADVFTRPTNGGQGARFDYSGTYAGLLNVGTPTAGGPGGTLNPSEAMRTTGRALITADFTEMRVSGGVDQRQIIDGTLNGSVDLPDIALKVTKITPSGTFNDSVRVLGSGGTWSDAGTYAGAFNADASAVATVMVFNPVPSVTEHGAIVLSSCTTSGGPACP